MVLSGIRGRTFGAAVLLIFVALLAWGCSGGEEAAPGPGQTLTPTGEPSPQSVRPKQGGTLQVAVVKDHSTFDPPIVLAVPDIVVTRQAYDNLILRDPDDFPLSPCWHYHGQRTTTSRSSRSTCARA